MQFPQSYDCPTLTFATASSSGWATWKFTAMPPRGETDEHFYLWLPHRGYLFCGDLIIWRSPNCGNPQKVQHYPGEWAEALEKMAALDAEWLFPAMARDQGTGCGTFRAHGDGAISARNHR